MSDEAPGFLLEIEIDAAKTFLDLCRIILESVGFTDDQPTSFYFCTPTGLRQGQVTREDMGFDKQMAEDVRVMGDTLLEDYLEEDQLLDFVFDPFNDRCFSLQVMEVRLKSKLDKAVVARFLGKPPVQLKEPDITLPKGPGDLVLDEDDMREFYGSDEFDSEDYDSEGYEVSGGDY